MKQKNKDKTTKLKKLALTALSMVLVLIIPVILAGCGKNTGTYNFIGIIGEDGKTVVLTEAIEDVTTKSYLEANGYLDSYIKLNKDEVFEWAQVLKHNQYSTTTIVQGKYNMADDIIYFHSITNWGSDEPNISSNGYDIRDDKIIIYVDTGMGGIFLVYSK